MRFLKVLKQPVRNIENIWKLALKWTRYLISILIVNFDLYEYVLATSLEKEKLTSLDCILDQVYAVIMESAVFCCITKPFCPETLKFLWDGFGWNPCWKRCEHRDGRASESKWEAFYWDINHQTRVIPEQRWKVLKLWTNGSGSEEQCVITSDLFPNCHRSDTHKF